MEVVLTVKLKQKHFVMGGLLLVAAALIAGLMLANHDVERAPEQSGDRVVMHHLDAIKANHIEEAYQLSSEAFKRATTFREFARFIENNPILYQARAMAVTSQQMEVDAGKINIELTDAQDRITKLAYDLVREGDAWRVLHINVVAPAEMRVMFGENLVDKFAKQPPRLTQTFDNKDNRYLVSYPSRWIHVMLQNGTTILSGKAGTRAYYSTVNIQTILSVKTGGKFKTVRQLIDDIKKQVEEMSRNPIFLESGPIEITEKNGTKAKGEYLIFTYSYNGYTYQQWDVIVSRNDGQVFYVWAYTSPLKQYTNDLPLAEAIFKAWQIY